MESNFILCFPFVNTNGIKTCADEKEVDAANKLITYKNIYGTVGLNKTIFQQTFEGLRTFTNYKTPINTNGDNSQNFVVLNENVIVTVDERVIDETPINKIYYEIPLLTAYIYSTKICTSTLSLNDLRPSEYGLTQPQIGTIEIMTKTGRLIPSEISLRPDGSFLIEILVDLKTINNEICTICQTRAFVFDIPPEE